MGQVISPRTYTRVLVGAPKAALREQQTRVLHDMRTAALVQPTDLNITIWEWLQELGEEEEEDRICNVDVNERHVFVREPRTACVCAGWRSRGVKDTEKCVDVQGLRGGQYSRTRGSVDPSTGLSLPGHTV